MLSQINSEQMEKNIIGIRQIVIFTPMEFSSPMTVISLLESKDGSQIAIGFQDEANSLYVDLMTIDWEKTKDFPSAKEGEDIFNYMIRYIKGNDYLVSNKEKMLDFFEKG